MTCSFNYSIMLLLLLCIKEIDSKDTPCTDTFCWDGLSPVQSATVFSKNRGPQPNGATMAKSNGSSLAKQVATASCSPLSPRSPLDLQQYNISKQAPLELTRNQRIAQPLEELSLSIAGASRINPTRHHRSPSATIECQK